MNIETISCNLRYWSDSREVEQWLLETISRLPEDVAEFPVDNCGDLSIGKTALVMVTTRRGFHQFN